MTAQFYGHTHWDEIEIYYDSETSKRPISVGYVGPSLTTFAYGNPGYRIYTIDGDHNETFYVSFIILKKKWREKNDDVCQ